MVLFTLPLCHNVIIYFTQHTFFFWNRFVALVDISIVRRHFRKLVSQLVPSVSSVCLNPVGFHFPVLLLHFCHFHPDFFNELCCSSSFLSDSNVIHLSVDTIFFMWLYDPMRVIASFLKFLDDTRRTTVGRTPLDGWSACSRDLYLTAHNTHNKHPCLRWDFLLNHLLFIAICYTSCHLHLFCICAFLYSLLCVLQTHFPTGALGISLPLPSDAACCIVSTVLFEESQ